MVRAPYNDKNGLKKGAWSKDEDERLRSYIRTYGPSNWRELPKCAGLLRCGKSCRLRWLNYLRPNSKRGNYTQEEEEIIIKLHEQLGNKWSQIANKLPERTDNDIKNHWHSHLKKRSKCNKITKSESKGKPNDLTSKREITQHSESANPISVGTSSYNILESSLPMSSETSYEENKSSSLTYNPAQSAMNGSREEDNVASWEAFEEFGSNFWTEPFIVQNSYSQDNCSIPINGGDTDQYVSCFYDAAELFNQVMPELPKD